MALEMMMAALLESAENSINPLLKTDIVTCTRLSAMAGQVIRFELTDLNLSLYLLPIKDGVQLQHHFPDAADVTLRGSSVAFLKLLQSDDKSEQFFGHGITVEGNTGLANRFQHIVADIQIDWEAILASVVGDLTAHQIAEITRSQINYAKKVNKSLTANLSEYIQEEIRVLPPRAEVDYFMNEVDKLRERTDRLSAQIALLIQQSSDTD